MLYLVATPIGNLGDFSHRAIETLKQVDYILCEDTRHSKALTYHYNIDKHLKSYHKFSEASRSEEVIRDLENGKTLALISDAGTPCISDPGYLLVQECRKKGITVQSIPGPCALISALCCSGLPTERFQFTGFVPKKESERKKMFLDAALYSGTTIGYESPRRLVATLKDLATITPQAQVSIARELTKLHEEVVTQSAEEQYLFWKERKEIKGEIVILIAGGDNVAKDQWHTLSPKQHVQHLKDSFDLSEKEAIKLAAEMRGVPKREVYNEFT